MTAFVRHLESVVLVRQHNLETWHINSGLALGESCSPLLAMDTTVGRGHSQIASVVSTWSPA